MYLPELYNLSVELSKAILINKKQFIKNKFIANEKGKQINDGHEQYLLKIKTELKDLESRAEIEQGTSSREQLRIQINKKNMLIADTHYQYAMHLNELRTYYFYCSKEAKNEGINYLEYLTKASESSKLLLQQFEKAKKRYELTGGQHLEKIDFDLIKACEGYDNEIDMLIKQHSSRKKRKLQEPTINTITPDKNPSLEENNSIDSNNVEQNTMPIPEPKISKFKKFKYSEIQLNALGLFKLPDIQTDLSQITSFSSGSSSLTTPSSCRTLVNSDLDKFKF